MFDVGKSVVSFIKFIQQLKETDLDKVRLVLHLKCGKEVCFVVEKIKIEKDKIYIIKWKD